MKWTTHLLAADMIMALAVPVAAQSVDVGKVEYQSSCASCHGVDAKGDGPVGQALKKRPADLTSLAKRNNGVFPFDVVYRKIDGRDDSVASHGTREMPVWGYRFVPLEHFNLKPADEYIYLAPASPEPVVRARILAVIDYLNRVQAK